MNILIINGANAKSSRLTALVNYVHSTLASQGMQVKTLDVISIPAEDLILTKFGSPTIIEARQLVEEADILFVATPVYKGSYSGILKTFLDLLPECSLKEKVCVPIAMGGTMAHLLMLEYTLKPVLSILGSTAIEHGVFALDKQVTITANGVDINEELKARIDKAIEQYSTLPV